MQVSTRVLGKSVADHIANYAAKPLLVIGRDTFYRRDLAALNCFHFLAAANLSAAVETLGPRDTRDLFENIPPTSLVVPRMGSIALAVLGAAFEHKGLGGDQPLESWMAKFREAHDLVTWHSMKESEHRREIGETKARKARKERTHSRRDQAQRIRGERYITRRMRDSNG